ncbi:MAG: glutathione synthase [Gammaproteobacteria bacterium]|jgi:glutathione synthase
MKLGVIMDPISGINIKKDSTFAMMLASQKKGWEIYYIEMKDLFIHEQHAKANTSIVSVDDNKNNWYKFHQQLTIFLSDLDVILMRIDPPFNMEYIYSTYILELAQSEGAIIINDPAGLRDVNEKMFINYFPECIAPTLVSRNQQHLIEFISNHDHVILKPLDGMGGKSVFKSSKNDPNLNVIIETLTIDHSNFIMAQKYIPEINEGDKRILLINGLPVEYALARIPMAGETRGNLAAGGTGKGVELTARDRWICEQVGPTLIKKGLFFVGLDVIGDYLTEINVTSPTCIRELDAIYNIDIGTRLMEAIEKNIIPR